MVSFVFNFGILVLVLLLKQCLALGSSFPFCALVLPVKKRKSCNLVKCEKVVFECVDAEYYIFL